MSVLAGRPDGLRSTLASRSFPAAHALGRRSMDSWWGRCGPLVRHVGALGAALLPTVLLTREALDYTYIGWWQGAALVLGISATLGAGSAATTLALAQSSKRQR
jgi:hypothetical protein